MVTRGPNLGPEHRLSHANTAGSVKGQRATRKSDLLLFFVLLFSFEFQCASLCTFHFTQVYSRYCLDSKFKDKTGYTEILRCDDICDDICELCILQFDSVHGGDIRCCLSIN